MTATAITRLQFALHQLHLELLEVARQVLAERWKWGEDDWERLADAYTRVAGYLAERYGEEGQAAVRRLEERPLSPLETYLIFHRLAWEVADNVGTALLNLGWSPDRTREFERAFRETLDRTAGLEVQR